MRDSLPQSIHTQRGAVLVVSLIILLIMTLLGVSNMRSSTLQVKMVNNTQARQQAFEAAEATLIKVETQLYQDGHDANLIKGCAADSATCYDANCAGGLCFDGIYNITDDPSDCKASTDDEEEYWKRAGLDVWNNASRHKTINIDMDGELPDPKYIVEFLCYIDENPELAGCGVIDETNCAPLYRVTALATSRDEKAKVMLQSTYRLTIN